MKTLSYKNKTYNVDKKNFLLDYDAWDEDFAECMAGELGMTGGLTEQHWAVIHFIRNRFKETGVCPVVHETARFLGLDIQTLQSLFPTGYLRGACLLAGISYRYGWVYYYGEPYAVSDTETTEKATEAVENKVYRVDLFGYLVDHLEWDADFAARRAFEIGIKDGLTDKHWKIIRYLRDKYSREHKIPTIYECCEDNQLAIDTFATLFPAGYHRGAVKIAGLPSLA